MINLSSLNINNKNLVIRVDMNVPIKDGVILDSTRIKACLPTINYALKKKTFLDRQKSVQKMTRFFGPQKWSFV